MYHGTLESHQSHNALPTHLQLVVMSVVLLLSTAATTATATNEVLAMITGLLMEQLRSD